MSLLRGSVLLATLISVSVGCGNNGGASPPTIATDVLTVDFGDQSSGSTKAKTLTVSNTGITALTISSVTIGGDTRHAFSTPALAQDLAAGASLMLQITYVAPPTEGADGAILTITSSASNSPELSISISGRSVAACVPESDSAFCTRTGKGCGVVSAADNCGAQRTVSNCGVCAAPQTCGGLGVANVCGTPVFPVTVKLAGSGGGTVVSTPGGINCGANCSASFGATSTVTLTAVPDAMSSFSGFSGDCVGPLCTFTVGAAMNVTATFAPLHTLTVLASGSGSGVITSHGGSAGLACTATAGTPSGTCSVSLPEGTVVDLAATPAAGSRFNAWSGACGGAACSITLNGDMAATASFFSVFPVSVSLLGSGTGTVTSTPPGISCGSVSTSGNRNTSGTCSATFDAGANVTLSASPGGASTFSGFSGACSGNVCAFSALSAAQIVSARFSAPPTKLAFTQQPADIISGATFAPVLTVAVEDALGNVVTASNAAVTLTPSASSLSGASTVNAVNGIATFNGLSMALAGNYTLTASTSGLVSATSNSFAVAAGAPAQLAFIQQPGNALSGAAIAPAVTVAAEDLAGNVVTSFNDIITLALNTGSGTLANASQPAAGGLATFVNLSLAAHAGSYALLASSDSLAPAVSAPFALSAGAPTRLVFTQQPPATAQSGLLMTQSVKVSIEDGAGNVVTSSSASIGLVSSGGTLAGGASKSATNGVASFALTLSGAAGSYTLTASGSGFAAVTSSALTLSAGNAAKLVFTQQPPASAQSGIAFSQAVKVSVEDANGNVVTNSTAPISLTSSGGTLTGGASQSAVSGVATFSLTLAGTAGNYTVAAASNGLASVNSNSIALSAGNASQLVFTQQPPATAQSGIAFTQSVKVSLEDANGNVLTGSTAPISLTSSGGTLTGGAAQAANNGVATFSLTLAGTAGNYTVAAASNGLASVNSNSIALSAGNASQLVFTQQPPATAQSGIAFTQSVKVSVEDVAGNVVTGSSAPISLTSSGGMLTGGAAQAANNGVATFSLTLAGTAGNYTLAAASNGLASVNSNSIALSAGNASQLVFTQQPPATAQSGVAFTQSVKVSVEDANGNVLTGSTAPISLTSSGGTLTGGASQSAVSGVATFSLTLAGTAGNYTVAAASNGLASVNSNSIALSAGNASQLVFTQQPPATAQSGVAFTQSAKVSVEDSAGNLVANSTATVALTPSGGTLTGGSQSAVGGVATFSLTLTGTAGNYTLTAASNGLSPATSSIIVLSAINLAPQWANQYKDAQRSSRLTTPGPSGASLRWRVSPTGNTASYCPLIAGDGTLYVQITSSGLYALVALDPATGNEVHRYAQAGNHVGCPTIGPDGTLYTSYGNSNLPTIYVALKPDFTEKWHFQLNPNFQYGWALTLIGGDGALYVTDPAGRSYHVTDNGASGTIGWQFPAAGQPVTKPQQYSALSPDSKTLYVNTSSGNNGADSLYAISTADGTLWASYGPFSNPVQENWRNVSVAPSGMVLAQSSDPGYNILSSNWGFPAVTGPVNGWTSSWKQSQRGWFWDQGAIDTDGTFYPARQDGYPPNPPSVAHIWKINPDGTVPWTTVVPGWSHNTVVDSNHMLYVIAGATVEMLRPTDQTVIWSYPSLSAVSTQMAMGTDGTIYVTTAGSDIYAFQPPAQKALITLGSNTAGIATQETEVFDPATGLFTQVGSISYTPSPQTAGGLCAAAFTLLGNGKPLVASGGCTDSSGSTNASSLFSSAAGTWAAGPNMTHARDQAAAVTLFDGRGMVIGGCAGGCSGPSGIGEYAYQVDQTVEIYTPTSNAWSAAGSLTTTRAGLGAPGAAVVLADGRVMVCGGNNAFQTTYNTCELYTVSSNTWAATGALPDAGARTLLLLPDTTVLALTQDGTTALRWTPSSGQWTTGGALLSVQQNPTLVLLHNGKVLLAGGMNPTTNAPVNTVSLYTPSSNSFSSTTSMSTARGYSYGTCLASGKVLVGGGCTAAGCTSASITKTAEIFDPTAASWTATTGQMVQERLQGRALLLP